MVRTVVASESFLAYLTTVVNGDTTIVGLILGQHTSSKDYVIHFAKTPPLPNADVSSVKGNKVIKDLSESWIAEHAKHATRLLPGGMHVLGLFVVSNEDPFNLENMDKIRSIMREVQEQLKLNKYLFANYTSSEKVVLHYCSNSRQSVCKSIDPTSGVLKPAEFKFTSSKIPWFSIECFYELSQTFPIQEREVDLSLKKHMSKVIHSIASSLKSAVFLFDGISRNEDEYLEPARKSKHSAQDVEKRTVQVAIILPRDCSELHEALEIRNCGGHIKLSGQIASKIWISQGMTVGEISKAVIQDIIRSLAARLEMHWDSLIEEEHGSPEDTNSIHEPPRRIFVKLPGTDLTLSDYLFPGEGPQEAEISLEELLDITVNEKEAILDIEGQADLTEFYNEKLEVESEDNLPKLPTDTSKFMYFVGGGIALLVLLISLVVHFMQNYM